MLALRHSPPGSRQSQRPDSEQATVSRPAEQRPGSGRWRRPQRAAACHMASSMRETVGGWASTLRCQALMMDPYCGSCRGPSRRRAGARRWPWPGPSTGRCCERLSPWRVVSPFRIDASSVDRCDGLLELNRAGCVRAARCVAPVRDLDRRAPDHRAHPHRVFRVEQGVRDLLAIRPGRETFAQRPRSAEHGDHRLRLPPGLGAT